MTVKEDLADAFEMHPTAVTVSYLFLVGTFFVYAGIGILQILPFPLAVVFGVIFVVFWLGYPIALYYDRKYVAEQSDWNPSRLYYLGILPGYRGLAAVGHYLYKRLEWTRSLSTEPLQEDSATSATASSTHSRSNAAGPADSRWALIAGLSVAVWALVLLAPVDYSVADPGTPGIGTPAVELFLVTWFLVPISIYCDCQYVREQGGWNPSLPLWVGASLVWLLNVFVVIAYLIRRDATVGLSLPSRPNELVPHPPAITSRWWYWIAYQPVCFIVYLVLVRGYVGGDSVTTLQALAVVGTVVLLIPVLVLLPLGFYLDARAVSQTDNGWHPNPYLYAGLGYVLQNLGWASDEYGNELFILGMGLLALVAVSYLERRHRHVGTP